MTVSAGSKSARNLRQSGAAYEPPLFAATRGFILTGFRQKWCPGAESNHRHEDFQLGL
jgi:hypothetical protein